MTGRAIARTALAATGLIIFCGVSARAAVTFEIPRLAAPSGMAATTARATDRVEVTAAEVAALTSTSGFWAGYGEECPEAFRRGFRESEPKNYMPKDRLHDLESFEACVARFKVDLTSQSRDTATLLTAEGLERDVTTKVAAAKNLEKGNAGFLGLNFGVGVGISHSQDDVISEAELTPAGLIVATKDNTTLPRVIFESHYFGFCRSKACEDGRQGVGPYFAIVAKSDDLISGFSAGGMYGWKDTKAGGEQGFSIGLGVLLDDDVISLADGFEAGQPLPAGETQIRYEEKSRWSAILFFTRTF